MSDPALTALASAAIFLGFCALIWAASFLVRDRKRRMKVATVTKSEPPRRDPLIHFCKPCDYLSREPEHEHPTACYQCGRPWTWSCPESTVTYQAVPTPDDEPPTLPEAS
jgi:hypothetical protein